MPANPLDSILGASPQGQALSAVTGLAAGGPSSAESGDSESGRGGTGDKTFNFGSNPNAGLFGPASIAQVSKSPVLIVGVVVVAVVLVLSLRKK